MAELRINERQVRILMAREGIATLEALADQSGVASSTFRRLFSGGNFNSQTVERLASVLKVNPIDLIETASTPPPLVDAQGVAMMASS